MGKIRVARRKPGEQSYNPCFKYVRHGAPTLV